MQNRYTDDKVIAAVGAAQIDMYGNLNTTCIGDYLKPDIRFAGTGGGCDVASFVPRCIAFMQHERRKFVRKLDYLTSPGQLSGKGSREKAGLRSGGITVVITNLAVMRFDDDSGQMYLDQYYPGVTPDKILEIMAFSVDVSRATEAIPPSGDELNILREKCDPQRLILNWTGEFSAILGADVNLESRLQSRTAIMEAARNRKVEAVKALLTADPDLDAVDWEGCTVSGSFKAVAYKYERSQEFVWSKIIS